MIILVLTLISHRHPDTSSRPSFNKVLTDLSMNDILKDNTVDDIGGPLENGHSLYVDLQQTYKNI